MKRLSWIIIFLVIGSIESTSQQSMACKMLATFAEKDGIFDWNKERNNVIVIDTFHFFTPSCNNKYGNKTITILNKRPEPFKNDKNIFFVNGIATGRNEAMAISILHSRSNHHITHYFSIFGNVVEVIKRGSGDF